MVHLRIVVPSHNAEHALDLLKATPSACNLIFLERAAQKPEGDVILVDIAREDASVIVSDLKEFGIHQEGSIAMEDIDSQISEVADRAEESALGLPSDAVVWEEVEARTSENTELSASFLLLMMLACLIASVGILLDSPILIIGAMVVGPEFGPIAGLCVAAVQRRGALVKRSLLPLAIGFPLGITSACLFALAIKGLDLTPGGFSASVHPNTHFISDPDEFSFIVAIFAGTAGMISLTNAKSGALVGVLISVTTIPAAANIGGRLRLRGLVRVARRDGPARGEPGGHPGGRNRHPLHPAQALPAAPPGAPAPRGAGARRAPDGREPPAGEGRVRSAAELESSPLPAKLAIVIAAFAAGVGLAEIFGAKNLGTALGIGQLTFVAALVYVLVWTPGARSAGRAAGTDR